jgi:hypothetical protein
MGIRKRRVRDKTVAPHIVFLFASQASDALVVDLLAATAQHHRRTAGAIGKVASGELVDVHH